MALRGTELILFVRAQNQASATLRRVASDVRALTHMRDLDARAERLAIQQAKIAQRQQRNLERIRDLGPGGSRRLALDNRRLTLMEKEKSLQRALQSIEDGRYRTNTQLLRNRERQLRIQARRGTDWLQFGEVQPRTQLLSAANQRQLVELEARMTAYGEAVKTTERRLRNLRVQQQKLNADYGKAQRLSRDLANEQAILARQSAALARAQADVADAMRLQRAEKALTIGRTVSHIGRTIQLAGLIATASLGASAASAAEFNTQITLAATQARNMGQSFEAIPGITEQLEHGFEQAGVHIKGILDLMQEYPATSQDMTNATYEIFSSMDLMENGVTDVAKGLGLLEIANKAAVAGQVDLAEATDAMIRVFNNFDPRLQNVSKNMDLMFSIVRFGKLRLDTLNDILTKVAPAAAGAGLRLEDVAGAISYLSRTIGPVLAKAGIARLIDMFRHPDFVAGAKAFGIEVKKSSGALNPILKIMQDITDTFPETARGQEDARNFFRTLTRIGRSINKGDLPKGLKLTTTNLKDLNKFLRENEIQMSQGLMGTIQSATAFNRLATGVKSFGTDQEKITNNVGEFNTAFQALMQTSGVRWRVFMNQLRVLVIELGEAVIPAFEAVGQVIGRIVEWFQNLSPHTKDLIGKFLAFGAIGALLAGTLLTIIGPLVALGAMLAILGSKIGKLGGVGILGRLGMLQGVLRGIAGVGAIAIILKTLWTGNATAIDFIQGAMLGAAAGSIFGPGGAVLGAITVPVIMKFIKDKNKSPMEKAYEEYDRMVRGKTTTLDVLNPMGDFWKSSKELGSMGVKEFNKQWMALKRQMEAGKPLAEVPVDILVRDLFSKAFPTKKVMSDTQKFFADLRKDLKAAGKEQEALELDNFLKDINEALTGTTGLSEGQADLAEQVKRVAQAAREARKQAVEDINSAAANLTNTFMQLRQANEQAFGQLFAGPWLDSEFGQTAEEWGIEPGIKDLTKDLQMQLDEFNRWNAGLKAIADRGAPAELINELKALGPDALEKIETLRKAAPGQFQAFVNVWKTKQAAIEQATKIDFNKQLQQWFKYGKGIAQQIIFGLRSENVALDNAFRKYITDKFPDYVAEAVAKARKEATADNATPKPKPPPKAIGGGNTTNNNQNQTNNIHVHPQKGENTLDTARRTAHLWRNGARSGRGGQGQ